MLSRTIKCPVHAVVDETPLLGGVANVVFSTDQSTFAPPKRFVTFEVGTVSLRFTHEDLREILRESRHQTGVA